jgi:NAD(P)-dependent dehydrogenase (short-subunit alcohol dehydrogenase family)
MSHRLCQADPTISRFSVGIIAVFVRISICKLKLKVNSTYSTYIAMGTVIITGANSSLGIPAVGYLLSAYPTYNVVLTVRNDSEQDANTKKLREVIGKFPNVSNTAIRKLDLTSSEEVQAFVGWIRSEIAAGQIPPLVAVIWNAMSWTLHGGLNFTAEGYERSMAVNHIAHFSMTLRLLGSLDPERGRIVFLSSDSHEKSGLQQFPTILPDDLNLAVHPPPDKEGETVGRGFQRYGLSKLVMVMTMYELKRRIKKASIIRIDSLQVR